VGVKDGACRWILVGVSRGLGEGCVGGIMNTWTAKCVRDGMNEAMASHRGGEM